jgi:hypothetical protein
LCRGGGGRSSRCAVMYVRQRYCRRLASLSHASLLYHRVISPSPLHPAHFRSLVPSWSSRTPRSEQKCSTTQGGTSSPPPGRPPPLQQLHRPPTGRRRVQVQAQAHQRCAWFHVLVVAYVTFHALLKNTGCPKVQYSAGTVDLRGRMVARRVGTWVWVGGLGEGYTTAFAPGGVDPIVTGSLVWLLPLAQQAPALLGFILFRLTLDGEDDTETLYVYELQVAEKARRLGLGKHLMQVGCGSGWPGWCLLLATCSSRAPG